MSKKARNILIGVVSGILVIAISLTVFGFLIVRQSFPQVSGDIQIEGLQGEVYVYRDAMGIPHIYAATLHDLLMAQGYVHAQDRFWQMDYWRHIGSGRLSEMFGESLVETDSFLRTLGWRQVAEQEWEDMTQALRDNLEAYTDGVNAYLENHTGTALSLEYGVLKLLNPGYQPEPWTPIHSLTWGKVMAWDLGGNMDVEIARAILLKTLTLDQVDELFPPYPQDHPVIVPEIGYPLDVPERSNTPEFPEIDFSMLLEKLDLMESILGPIGPAIGSNSWAVSGEHTASGMPLLANDMHLAIQMPSIWYQNSLHCRPKSAGCSLEITGYTFVGVPGVVVGHNENIAWGYTNAGPDVIDLYIEKINPENPDQYEYEGRWVDMDIRTETILVGGGEPVELIVRSTRHGPIITETYDLQDFNLEAGVEVPDEFAIAMRWTALEPVQIFEAIWGFNNAQDWEDFRQAARNFSVPAQNLLYADVEGNIGYQMPGNIPIRQNGDGRFPVPGWTDAYEWTGYIPFDELPFTFNPPSGYIVTANNQAHPFGYPYLFSADVDYGFRAQRIVDMIESASEPIDIPYVQQMHADAYNMNAETLVPFLMAIQLDDPHQQEVRALLDGWDYQNGVDSAPAALFEVFWKRLLENTFQDDLPDDYWPEGGARWVEVYRNLVREPDSEWWDDQNTTERVESMDDIFAVSFAEAVAEIESLLGRNSANWAWGALHKATFENQTLGQSGIGLIEALFNRGPFSTGGGDSLVNATGWVATEGYQVDSLPSQRAIYDLSDFRNSLAIHTTGQSGHAYHPHYIDMAPLWANVEYYEMLWNEQAVIANAQAVLVLTP